VVKKYKNHLRTTNKFISDMKKDAMEALKKFNNKVNTSLTREKRLGADAVRANARSI